MPCKHQQKEKITKNIDKVNIDQNLLHYDIYKLKLLLNYLRKHHELKVIYNAYKDVMNHYLNLKKKFSYFSYISKPLIPESKLKYMVKKQEDLMTYVDNLNKKIPKL